jgi:AGZA family xanthine/uracil permease-like MFS transporter
MGLNAALVALCVTQGVSWHTAMGVVFVEGFVITLLVITKLREAILKAIPTCLKHAISVGIGLFIAEIGLVNAGIIKINQPTAPLTFGSFQDQGVLVATIGLILTFVLVARKIRAALLIGILVTTLIAIATGLSKMPSGFVQIPRFDTVAKVDLFGALRPTLWATILAFMLSDFFDTMGTAISIHKQAGLLDAKGRIPKARALLLADSLAAMIGGFCGCSSCTSYIESGTGIGEGGRTGLMPIVTGVLFLLALFFSPLVGSVPPQATAPALIVVGYMMLSALREIETDKPEEMLPVFLTLIAIPLTYSIAHGIGFGFITYALLMAATGRAKEVHPLLWGVTALFVFSFAVR